MLEPTFRCNLACAGCGRIREYRDVLDQMLTADQCLAATEEAGAPVVSITGGEPLLHPEIERIVGGILERKRFVYLCTNGLLLESSLSKFEPNPYLSFVIHLDGLAPTHDHIAGRNGVFDTAIAGIRAAKGAGFQVRTNTTIYKGTNLEETKGLFASLSEAGVDGIMVSPAFSFEAVDNDVFLSRSEANNIFQSMHRLRKQFRFYNTPIYWDFLEGRRELSCIPWSNPTVNPKGWKSPCYLITDGHCQSFRELMDETPWERYGAGNDPRCANCMVHYGFEADAVKKVGRSLSGMWKTMRWNFLGS
jgi:hopanoid biosynthesis associated radical SAM protein HpnH